MSAANVLKILLSTFNGEKYLAEQLSSLLRQTYPQLRIIIRDDGSTDATMDIVRRYALKDERISYSQGANVGPAESFLSLLKEENGVAAAYYAFCDQDDIWKPDKVERAVAALQSRDTGHPVLYCSGYTLFDSETGRQSVPPGRNIRPGLRNALVENIATGCTLVLNRSARNLVISRTPRCALMHDWWCYLVVSAFGCVIYDPYASVQYRQHASNVIGAEAAPVERWKKRIRMYRKRRGIPLVSRQAADFYDLYKDLMDAETKKTLEDFLSESVFSRAKNTLLNRFYRQSFIDDVIFKILYLLKRV